MSRTTSTKFILGVLTIHGELGERTESPTRLLPVVDSEVEQPRNKASTSAVMVMHSVV